MGRDETTRKMNARMRRFGTAIISLFHVAPESQAMKIVAGQLIRSATSVGANYRASQRARSSADMIAKLKIVEEELDESIYWMEVLVESSLMKKESLKPIHREANELIAIVVASIKTLRAKKSIVREDVRVYDSQEDDLFGE